MNRLLDRIRELWCIHVHRSAMWPVRGRYRCAVCLHEYPVPFEMHRNNVLPITVGQAVRRRLPDSAIARETAKREPSSIPA